MVDGILHRKVEGARLLVAPTAIRNEVLHLAHDDPSAGHLGFSRTFDHLQQRLYWPGMREDVQQWLLRCDKCGQRKTPTPVVRAPTQSIEVGHPMEFWSMDIVGPLPVTAQGNQYILVMSDHDTKWVEAAPIPNQRAETVAQEFVKEVISRHGVPEKILTDQGRNFESDLMKKVFEVMGIEKLRTSAYHPQTDGQVERFNRTLKALLTSFVNDRRNDWDLHLHMALFAYRNSRHTSTGVSPFLAVHGREARMPLDFSLNGQESSTHVMPVADYVDQVRQVIHKTQQKVTTNMEKAQQHQQKSYDQHYRTQSSIPLLVGQKVWLYNTAVPRGGSRKFHRTWSSPYIILLRVGEVNYCIQPVSGHKRSLVVHRNRLKSCLTKLPPCDSEPEIIYTAVPEMNNPTGEPQAQAQPPVVLRRSTRQRYPPERYIIFWMTYRLRTLCLKGG